MAEKKQKNTSFRFGKINLDGIVPFGFIENGQLTQYGMVFVPYFQLNMQYNSALIHGIEDAYVKYYKHLKSGVITQAMPPIDRKSNFRCTIPDDNNVCRYYFGDIWHGNIVVPYYHQGASDDFYIILMDDIKKAYLTHYKLLNGR